MSESSSTTGQVVGSPPSGVVLKDASVSLVGVNPTLLEFLGVVGKVHAPLYGIPCVVTSARDGQHAASSKHGTGDAVDLRISDKTDRQQAALFMILRALSVRYSLAIFDESMLPGAGHVHVEIAG